MEGAKGRVNFFENMFHTSFPVQCGFDPQSKIFKKVCILERIIVEMNRRKIAYVELKRKGYASLPRSMT